MEPDPVVAPTMTLAEVAGRLRSRWLVIVALTTAGLLAGGVYSVLASATYQATAVVQVQPVVIDRYGNIDQAKLINMATELQVAQSAGVLGQAATTLQQPQGNVAGSVSFESPQETQILKVRYSAGTAARAAAGAQAVAEAYVIYRQNNANADVTRRLAAIDQQITDIQSRMSGSPERAAVAYQDTLRSLLSDQRSLQAVKNATAGTIVSPASAPGEPSSPKRIPSIALGLALGLLLSLVYAIARPGRQYRPAPRVVTSIVAPKPASMVASSVASTLAPAPSEPVLTEPAPSVAAAQANSPAPLVRPVPSSPPAASPADLWSQPATSVDAIALPRPGVSPPHGSPRPGSAATTGPASPREVPTASLPLPEASPVAVSGLASANHVGAKPTQHALPATNSAQTFGNTSTQVLAEPQEANDLYSAIAQKYSISREHAEVIYGGAASVLPTQPSRTDPSVNPQNEPGIDIVPVRTAGPASAAPDQPSWFRQ